MKKLYLLLISVILLLVSCNKENNSIVKQFEINLFNYKFTDGYQVLYDFQEYTKSTNKASLKITTTIDKEYLNKLYEETMDKIEYDKDSVNTNTITYDGKKYKIETSYEKTYNYEYDYNYFIVSKEEKYTIDSIYEYNIGVCLSNDNTLTEQKIMYSYLSSDHSKLIQASTAIPVLSGYIFKDLAFKNDKILNISYQEDKNSTITYYYNSYASNSIIRNVLNTIEFKKEVPEGYKFSNDNQIRLSLSRYLINDNNNLMLNLNSNTYILDYIVDINNGVVIMTYPSISTDIHNLYAKIDEEKLNELKKILDSKYEKSITKGLYITNNSYYAIELKDNNIADIYTSYPNEKIGSFNYTIIDNVLTININDHNYVFNLVFDNNKGITLDKKKSNTYYLFDIGEGLTFYIR